MPKALKSLAVKHGHLGKLDISGSKIYCIALWIKLLPVSLITYDNIPIVYLSNIYLTFNIEA